MSTAPLKKVVKVMVFGTFDGLHEGHHNFFKQARSLASQTSLLIVSVARDKNVFKIKKRWPMLKERQRIALIKKSKLADKVILGGAGDHIPHIMRIRPDIIALGYDQHAYVKNLRKDLKAKGVVVKIVRLKPYKEKIYKNSLLNRNGSTR